MASDQLSRRENTTTEREIYVEKDKVPKMTTHFESLAEKARSDQSDVTGGKQTPHGSTEERATNTVVQAFGADQKTRERHELKSPAAEKAGKMNVSATKVDETEEENKKQKAQEFNTDKAKRESIVGEKEAEGIKGRENQLQGRTRGRPHAIVKFEVSAEEETGGSTDQSKGKYETTRKQNQGSTEVAVSREEKDKATKLEGREEGGEKPVQLSLEEISKLRATAQQNTMETIRAAEARYNKAKESPTQGLIVAEYAKEKGAQAKENDGQAKGTVLQGAQDVAVQAKDTVLEGAKKTSQFISEKGSETKDAAAEKIQHGYGVTKDTVVSAGRTTVDYTVPKAEQAKDYALQKTVKAKDSVVDVSKNIASYAGGKAVATKDVTIEKGKEAAEFAGKVAADVKDKAVAAGWSATHYATEKAAEGTKAAARVVEYAGHKAAEIAAKPLGAAAAVGESVKEYTARKKEEAEREIEAKTSSKRRDNEQEENKEGQKEGEQQENLSSQAKEKAEEVSRPPGNVMTEEETFQGSSKPNNAGERQNRRQDVENKEPQSEEDEQGRAVDSAKGERFQFEDSAVEEEGRQTSVLGAIGETIVEIAQTTKDLVTGFGPNQPETEGVEHG